MILKVLAKPDKDGIIKALPKELSLENRRRIKKFGVLMFLYNMFQDHFVRPRIHKADVHQHQHILQDLLEPIRYSFILDIACGTGAAMKYMDQSNEYIGLDISYSLLIQAVKRAQKHEFKKCDFILGNAEELIFEDNIFDYVVMDTALHMLPKYDKAISEVSRVLKAGGIFICSTPIVGICDEFDLNWSKISKKRNLHSFSANDVAKVCSSNNLNYDRVATNGGMLYFQAKKLVA